MNYLPMPQDVVDHHCKSIRESIKAGDLSLVTCLNYLKNHASSESTKRDWQWIGAQLVMSGWLTVDDQNNFQVKGLNYETL